MYNVNNKGPNTDYVRNQRYKLIDYYDHQLRSASLNSVL